MTERPTGYQRALEAIRQCAASGDRHLTLRSLRMHELPREVGTLTHLRELELVDNDLICLPPEIGLLSGLHSLVVDRNRLESLPNEISSLVSLRQLSVHENQLSYLPDEIGELESLQVLYVCYNQLKELPQSIGKLKSLTSIYLHHNRIKRLPAQLSSLTSLETVTLSDNPLKTLPRLHGLKRLHTMHADNVGIERLPRWLYELPLLRNLSVSGNQLAKIDPKIGDIRSLEFLDLASNKLSGLPPTLSSLEHLEDIRIDDNPLPEAYHDALKSGIVGLKALLSSLADDTTPLFEAKLLVTGEGRVGKSWAIAALRGGKPNEDVGDDNTTWGIERGLLSVPHPKLKGEKICLNTWDFGGQRIYRVTHQFFFSEQAIYLLVWNPRAGPEQCRVHEWLRTIALRTGSQLSKAAGPDDVPMPKAKVIMVATHAKDKGGSYVADYGRSNLDRDLRDMIVDEIEIDSRKGYNINALRRLIAKHAACLPGMGEPLNSNWSNARDATLALRENKPRITFEEFSQVCESYGVVDPDQQRSLAWTYLHSLGRAVWYGQSSPDEAGLGDTALENTIILDAVWLSRAFVQILDDKATVHAGGMLDHRWLRRIWTDHGRPEWHRYEPGEYEILKQVMRRFDVALPTRESDGRRSLVPQLVPHDRPTDIPWSVAPNARSIRMRCELGFEAIGLMPRLIAATEPWHVYVQEVGLFWERGVFLRDNASFQNEALVTLSGIERPRLEIVVSGDRPDFLMHEFYRTLEAVLRFWKGMVRNYFLGCPSVGKDDQRCAGLFNYESVVRRIKDKVSAPFNCEICDENWSAEQLINGFEAMMISEKYILHHLYNRDQILAPRVCLLEPAERKALRFTSWASFVGKRFKLTLISELSGRAIASKEFTLTREWVKWVRPVTRAASLVLTGAALPFGGDLATAFKEQSSVLEKLGALPEDEGALSSLDQNREGRDLRLSTEEIANFAALLLAIGLEPRKHGMDITRAPDGRWLWMSADEVRIYKPQAPA